MLVDSNDQPLQPKKEGHIYVISIPEDELPAFALVFASGVTLLPGMVQDLRSTAMQIMAHIKTSQTLLEPKL